MSLINRLSGVEQPKIQVHQFWASFVEYSKSKITEANIKSTFSIVDGSDLTEWSWLLGKYDSSANKTNFVEMLQVLFILAEKGLYDYNIKSVMQTRINELP